MKTEKELKAQYREKKFRIGVFQIKNLVNGKVFIAGSVNLDAIFNRNRMELKLGGHPNKALQSEWNQFGEDNFAFEVLFEMEPGDNDQTDYVKEVRELEKMYVAELKPYGEKGYHSPKR